MAALKSLIRGAMVESDKPMKPIAKAIVGPQKPVTPAAPPATTGPSLYSQAATVAKPAPAPTPAAIRGGDAEYVDPPSAPTAAAAAPVPPWVANIQAEQARNPMGPMPAPAPAPAPTAPTAQSGYDSQALSQAGLDPKAVAANPQGFQDWHKAAAAQESKMPGTTMLSPATPVSAPTAPASIYKSAMNQGFIDGAQYTPTTQDFNEAKGVEGRTDAIIGKDSALMQRAEAKARQAMNARGLMNSSMAVGAGQAAVLDAATQIANADAGYYQQQALANQNATNTAARDNASMRGNLGMEGMRLDESGRQSDAGRAQAADQFTRELGENTRQFDATIAQRSEQFTQDMANKLQLAGVDKDTRLALIAAETDSRNLIAGNENIANAWGTTMNSIDRIQNNPDIEAGAKSALIDNALAGFKSFTRFWQKATGGAVDVSNLLDFGVVAPGTPAAGGGSGGTSGSTGSGGTAAPQQPVMSGPYPSYQDWANGQG